MFIDILLKSAVPSWNSLLPHVQTSLINSFRVIFISDVAASCVNNCVIKRCELTSAACTAARPIKLEPWRTAVRAWRRPHGTSTQTHLRLIYWSHVDSSRLPCWECAASSYMPGQRTRLSYLTVIRLNISSMGCQEVLHTQHMGELTRDRGWGGVINHAFMRQLIETEAKMSDLLVQLFLWHR